jgi:flavin-dependent dehydrogenase
MPYAYDVAIVGGGPAGATCAALCARAGLRTIVFEKAIFPREKVCGDCLNPACWPVLDELGIADRILAQPHSRLADVEFISPRGRSLHFSLTPSSRGEIAIKRSVFDAMLLARARELGAEVHENTAVTALDRGWKIETGTGAFAARILVAADGRNSTVARLLGLLPAAARDRIGLQTHIAAPPGFGERVAMHFLPRGYCGVASVGGAQLNVCLVSRAEHLADLKA